MLAIRMQRLGRKGYPTYRVVVQDVRQAPTSGKYVALLGSYDPHSKTNTLAKEKAEFYLSNGARPSDRVARLLSSEGIVLPSWVKQPAVHTRATRNPEKLRKNQPKEEAVAEEPATETAEAPAEVPAEAPETEAEASTEAESTETSAADTAEEAAEAPGETPKET